MRKTPLAKLALITGSVLLSVGLLRGQEAPPLDLPTAHCPALNSVGLSDALSKLGVCVGQGYVLFGLDEVLHDGKEPTVDLQLRPGETVGSALRGILAQLPTYELGVVSAHLIDLRPVGAEKDNNDLLNLRVPRFDVVSKSAFAVLNGPRRLIPELDQALTPRAQAGKQVLTLYFGGYQGDLFVTLHLLNATVRDILNATVVASEPFAPQKNPEGWVYAFDPGQSPESGHRHTWRTLFSLPRDWNFKRRPSGSGPPR